MNGRIVAVLILAFALLASLVNITRIPLETWNIMDNWAKVNTVMCVLSPVATLLVSFYVDWDYYDVYKARVRYSARRSSQVTEMESGRPCRNRISR